LCARNLPAKLEIYGLATLKLLTGSERYSDLLGFKNESIATQQLIKKGKDPSPKHDIYGLAT
jgi:hypothetical protein